LNGRAYNSDWIERQLAHGDADDIRDTYNHATYLPQREDMMQAWADSIDALCAGANVVSIKRKA
jgi:integrase